MKKYIASLVSKHLDTIGEKMVKQEELNYTERFTIETFLSVIDIIATIAKTICKVNPKVTEYFEMFIMNYQKIKTPTHHARIFLEEAQPIDDIFIIRRKGFLKPWSEIRKDQLPPTLATEIFDRNCLPKRRELLVKKIIKLKAFW